MSRAAWRTVTGNMRPALSITSARISAARRAPSAVADIASRRSSGRSRRLQVEAERQRQVGVERALVHLVQQHRGDAVQAGIGLQAANQQALGDDLDPRVGGDGGVEPGAVADGLADRFAEQRGHARGGGAGGEAARLQHQDVPSSRQGASSSASGTRVVLPAPGGATSTALRPAARWAARAGSASVTGRSGSGGRMPIHLPQPGAGCHNCFLFEHP